MLRRLKLLTVSLCTLCAASRATAVDEQSTAVVSSLSISGFAAAIFAIAGTLLFALVFRSTIAHMVRLLTVKIGTRRIKKILSRRSKDVLDDIIIPGVYGGLTRIDHAILTAGGILCVQTKHYNGIVFGGADDPQWTNVDGIRRQKFLNPLIQNEGRTRALSKLIPEAPVANLVVFTGDVQFTSQLDKNVIHVRDLDSYIAKFVFGPCKITDWDAIWMSVRAAVLTDDASRKDFGAQLSFS